MTAHIHTLLFSFIRIFVVKSLLNTHARTHGIGIPFLDKLSWVWSHCNFSSCFRINWNFGRFQNIGPIFGAIM